MAKLNTNMLLFNGAGILAAAVVVGYNVNVFFRAETLQACSLRYSKMTQLALSSSNGQALTPIELQARSGSGERGVLENAKVVAAQGAPTPLALEVKLARTGQEESDDQQTGVRMSWQPSSISATDAACLSYSVWLPENFDFGMLGTLPGLFGGARPTFAARSQEEAEKGFAARIVWGTDGESAVAGYFPAGPEGIGGTVGGGFVLARGRWVKLDQELLLNRPGEADGTYRLWLDDKLVSETREIVWRRRADVKITGLAADVGATGARSPSTLRISAPVIAWQ